MSKATCPAAERAGEAVEQGADLFFCGVLEHAVGDDHGRSVVRHPAQPLGVAEWRAEHRVVRSLGIELAAQLDHVGIVEIEPRDTGRARDPRHAGVKAATEIEDDGVAVSPDELDDPVVELLGSQRQQTLATETGQLREVVIDQAEQLVGLGVVEDRLS